MPLPWNRPPLQVLRPLRCIEQAPSERGDIRGILVMEGGTDKDWVIWRRDIEAQGYPQYLFALIEAREAILADVVAFRKHFGLHPTDSVEAPMVPRSANHHGAQPGAEFKLQAHE